MSHGLLVIVILESNRHVHDWSQIDDIAAIAVDNAEKIPIYPFPIEGLTMDPLT